MNTSLSSRVSSLVRVAALGLATGAALTGCGAAPEDAADDFEVGVSESPWTEAREGTFTDSHLRLVNGIARPFDLRVEHGDRGGCVYLSTQAFALLYPGERYTTPSCFRAVDRERVSRLYATPASPYEMADQEVHTPAGVPDFTVRVTGLRVLGTSATIEADGMHLRANVAININAYSWLVDPTAQLSNVAIDARIVTNRGYLAADQVRVDLGPWNVSCGAADWCAGYVSDAIGAQRESLQVKVQNKLNAFLWKSETYGYVYNLLGRVENTLNAGTNPSPWAVNFGSLRFAGGAFRYAAVRTGLASTPSCEVRVGCNGTAVLQCAADADRFIVEQGARSVATVASEGRGATTRIVDRRLETNGKRQSYRVCAVSTDARGTEQSRNCTAVSFVAASPAECKDTTATTTVVASSGT